MRSCIRLLVKVWGTGLAVPGPAQLLTTEKNSVGEEILLDASWSKACKENAHKGAGTPPWRRYAKTLPARGKRRE